MIPTDPLALANPALLAASAFALSSNNLAITVCDLLDKGNGYREKVREIIYRLENGTCDQDELDEMAILLWQVYDSPPVKAFLLSRFLGRLKETRRGVAVWRQVRKLSE